MEMKAALENYAESMGWENVYARRDYQNLHEVAQFIDDTMEGYGIGETVMFIDPIVRDGRSGDMKYSGNIMILTKSDLDTPYDERFQLYIEPVKNIVHGAMYNRMLCDFDVSTWRSVEVINVLDYNADGVSVQFNVKGY